MSKGISVFSGMGYSLEENLAFIKTAASKGFDMLFTSLHIPEADYEVIIKEFSSIVKTAKDCHMSVIADISPQGFKFLGIEQRDLKAIKDLGIDVLRVDFGFSPEEIAEFSRNPFDLKIEINASTVTKSFLMELESHNTNFNNFQGCHNYYPRLNTGISEKSLLKKNDMLRKYGMKISAFIPSLVNKRGPVNEGLPTLEIHRLQSPETSAKHLFALGVDNVLFGDSIPSKDEISLVGEVDEKVIELGIKRLYECDVVNALLSYPAFSNRSDSAEDVIRATESRLSIERQLITAHNTIERQRGHVTVDNEGYKRYMGELQICKKGLPPDERVNVIAKVIEEDIFLLDYIDDEVRFKFKPVT
jgi:uncharacterized protein